MTQPTNEQEMRELDAWIYEHVFGERIFGEAEMLFEARSVWETQPQCRSFMMGFDAIDGPNGIQFRQSIPRYSTDPAAAMLVLEKLIENRRIGLESFGWPPTAMLLDSGNGSTVEHLSHGDSLPHAICRFAKSLFERSKSR